MKHINPLKTVEAIYKHLYMIHVLTELVKTPPSDNNLVTLNRSQHTLAVLFTWKQAVISHTNFSMLKNPERQHGGKIEIR